MKIKIIPLHIRIWKCLTGWKQWRQRRIIDKAAVLLYNQLHEYDAAELLIDISDKLWARAYDYKDQGN